MIAPFPVQPDSLYDEGALRWSLGISPTAVAQARRSGKLRYTKIGKRVLYRGQWVLDWLDANASVERKAVPA